MLTTPHASAQHANRIDSQAVREQFARLAPYYQQAHALDTTVPGYLQDEAVKRWQANGDSSLLGAAVAVIEVLDDWRAKAPRTAVGRGLRQAA